MIVGRKPFPDGRFVSLTDLYGTYPLHPEIGPVSQRYTPARRLIAR
jgi:hypothetical protein